MSLEIIAVHEDFLVVVKPAGLSFHTEDGQASLVDLARQTTGFTALFPVHRLDKITSGLVLLARNEVAARRFGTLFAAGKMEKYYLALSRKSPSKKQGAIKGAMAKGRNGSWRLAREEGPMALTQFFSYGLGNDGSGLRLFVLRPRTGRTHQLRVALKSLGSPILGDARYGGEEADRGYLHAYRLRFDWQGQSLAFTAPLQEGEFFRLPALATKLAELDPVEQLPWPEVRLPQREPAGR